MVTRRTLLAVAGAAPFARLPGAPAAVVTYRVEGSAATVALRRGDTAVLLLHAARRWHYEIAPIDTGEGGGITGHHTGTAVTLHPTAYPPGGSERPPAHQVAIVRDILADCGGTVAWGGDRTPAACGLFHIAVRPGDAGLRRAARRLGAARPGARSLTHQRSF
ncbi:hypothetical protein AB0M02_21670 [Actinoplanes sp. NPDC051861]|uniref:hypothetical protein n=1 Tax=Actinoplanes sp. NPDC051861 TaxID=3155170 RepID=UPI0034265D6A